MYKSERLQIPIWEKSNLTVDEAAAYFNMGRDKIRQLTDVPNCEFVLFVGGRRLIKRRQMEKYFEGMYSV